MVPVLILFFFCVSVHSGLANVECPKVDGPDSVYYPHEDCAKFYQCSNGVPYVHNCSSGLHFNSKLNVCDYPLEAGCEEITIDYPSSPPSDDNGDKNFCLLKSFLCPPIDGSTSVYFPQQNCTKFCQCSNGVPYEHTCRDGLHFNPTLNVCDWPENAGCRGSETHTCPTITTPFTPTDSTTPNSNSCQKEGIVCPAVDGPDSVYFPLSDCTKFCQCSNGVPYEHDCPAGLHFNPKLNVCDWPQNAGCGGSDTVTTEQTVTPTQDSGNNTNPTPAPNSCQKEGVVCPAVDGPDSVYFPLSDCTKFCQCSNGVPYEHDCPAGLHFNPKLNVCDWPQNAGCGASDPVTTAQTITPTEDSGNNTNPTPAPNSCQKESVVCPAVDGPDSVYFPLRDCTKFCQCSNGVPYEHACPAGLHFNPKLNVCDWPQNAGCGGSDPVTTEQTVTPTQDSGNNTNSTPAPNSCQKEGVVCPAVDGPDSVYYPLSNCTKFCQCSNGVPYEHDCPAGLHFNPKLNVCDWPQNAGCGGSDPVTTEQTVTTTQDSGNNTNPTPAPNSCQKEGVVCPAVDGPDSVYLPLRDCTKFCQCSNGVPYEHACPAGLHFNPKLNVCDWPQNAGCGGSDPVTTEQTVTPTQDSGNNTNSTPAPNSCQKEGVVCPAVDGPDSVYFPLRDCTKFCQCSNDVPYEHACPAGLHFNPKLNVCDWPQNAGCGGSDPVTTEQTATPTQDSGNNTNSTPAPNSCQKEGVVCPAVDGPDSVYLPLSDCTKFCQCSNGVPYEHDCPAGLHFNPKLNVCDWPQNAGCGGSDPVTTEHTVTPTQDSGNNTNPTLAPNSCQKEGVVCPAIDGPASVYFPLSDCTKFCQCSNGVPYEHACPAGLHFNPKLNVCDWPQNAGCGGSDPVTTEKTVTTTQDSGNNTNPTPAPSSCQKEGVVCPAVDGPDSVYFPLSDCTKFCQCSNGVPYEHACPAGLHFNPKFNVCDWPQNAGCGGSDPVTTEQTVTPTQDSGNNTNPTPAPNSCQKEGVVCPAVDGPDSVYLPLRDCTKFCQCSNGVPYEHACPAGLHFNPKLKVCDWPQNAGCGGSDPVTTEQTVTPTQDSGNNTNSTPAPNSCQKEGFVCPAVDGPDSVYFPLRDCTKFCQCSNGVPYEHACPAGLHFNPKLNVCDWPQNAGCGGSDPVTTEQTVTPTQDSGNNTNSTPAPNSCQKEGVVCPAVDGPDSVYFPLSDCTKFCQCSNGVPYEHDCPAGLHFNPKLNVCDWPQNSGCGGSDPVTTEHTVTPTQDSGNNTNPTPAPNSCQKESVVCPAVDGTASVYFPLSDCTKFCQCSNGVPYEHACPAGLHFNPKLNVCDWPQNAGCGGSDPVTTEQTVTTTQDSGNNTNPTPAPSSCQKDSVVCPAVDGPDSVYFPLSDCTKFCQCSNGVPYEHACPAGLHFNPKLNVCDWPQNAGCAGSDPVTTEQTVTPTQDSGNNTNPTPAPSSCQQEGVVCSAVDGPDSVYFPLSDCTKFCQCSNGVPYEHACPAGLHFNPKLNVCDWPQNAGCGGSDPVTTEQTVTPTQDSGHNTNPTPAPNSCQKENVVCPAVDGPDSVYFPLSDCTKFCQCSNGVPYEHNCPAGLHFNPKLNVCDWPQNAGCGGSDPVTTEQTVTQTQDSGNNTNPTPAPNSCQKEGVVCPAVDGPDSVYFPLSDCTKFCQCSNGVPYEHACPAGLHFNPKLNVCDWPQNAGCAGSDPVTTEQTVTPTQHSGNNTNPTPAPSSCQQEGVVCSAVDGPDSVYFPLSDCTKFCQCSNGVPYEHACPAGLHFNPKLNVCDWPQNAGCGGSDPVTTEQTVTPTQDSGHNTNPTPAPNSCQKENVVCPAVDGPDSVYFPLSDCTKFCQCSNGVPYEHNCPAGLHFNPKLNVCDWPQNAGCGGSDPVTTEQTVTQTQDSGNNTNPTPAPNSCQKEGVVCPAVDGPDSVYFPLIDCTKFCQCSNGVPYEHACPAGLHFNPKLNVCDWPQNAGCGGSDPVTTEQTVTPTQDSGKNTNPSPAPNSCQKEGVVCPAVDGPDSVYFPLSDCTRFCQCSNGVPYEHDCPAGLHFNPKLNICDWPEKAGCENSDPVTTEQTVTPTQDSGNNTNPTPAPNSCQKEGVVCPAVDGPDSVYFPLSDCTKFCQCSNGVPYEHDCPAGLHFNPKLNICDWPEKAGCENSDLVTTEQTVAPTPDCGNDINPTPGPNLCQKEGVVCPAVDGPDSVYFPLTDCSKFCQCSNGVPIEHTCPASLYFNPTLNVCDWPQNAGCKTAT